MHGPVAAIAPGWPVIAVAPSGPALESMKTAIRGLAERGAKRDRRSPTASDVLARRRRAMRLVPGRAGVAEPADHGDPGPARGRSGSRS